MYFIWIWTLLLLGIVLSGVRVQLRSLAIVAGFALWFFAGLFFFVDAPEPIGHEAEYLRFFRGETPGTGDTSLYPAMQIWWWLWSFLSPLLSRPFLISSLFGLGSVVLLSMTAERLFQVPRIRLILWLLTLPTLSGWSLSIYNVIIPFFFVVLSLWYLLFRESLVLVFASLALAVLMRLELLLVYPFLLLWCWQRKGWSRSLLFGVMPLLSLSSMVGYAIPGDGERWLAFQNNWFLWAYYEPLYWYSPLLFWRLINKKSWDEYLWWGVSFILWNHAIMASFNDFASRHVLISIVPIAFILSPYVKGQWFWVLLAGNLLSLLHFGRIFHADQNDFQQFLREEYSDLVQYSLEDARERECAWVVEMDPFVSEQSEKILSHFNLLDPKERLDLRKQYRCIDWCFTEQDWQWSSLGIRDRAIRLQQLFELHEVGIVQAQQHQCLLYSVREKEI